MKGGRRGRKRKGEQREEGKDRWLEREEEEERGKKDQETEGRKEERGKEGGQRKQRKRREGERQAHGQSLKKPGKEKVRVKQGLSAKIEEQTLENHSSSAAFPGLPR